MKYFLNIIPTLSFFISYIFYNIFISSMTLVITSFISLIITKLAYKSISKHDLFNLICIIFFGLLTFFSHNSDYIKWKITILYLLIFLGFLINIFFMKKTFLEIIFENKIHISKHSWKKLNILWSLFFLMCSIINTYVIFLCSEKTWVTFKVFGLTTLMLIAIIISGLYTYSLKINQQNN